jgi:hypothetical protein
MRFEVPQFIDVEDKIFGPLTFKQFIYLAGGGGLAYVSYKIVPFPFWIILTPAFVVLALLLAFYKLNNRTFIEVAQSWISFMLKGKLYIWQRSKPIIKKPEIVAPVAPQVPEKIYTEKTITDLAQNLDILDSYRQ